ncbi:isochorismatase family protein [Kurthia sibirica]|uniref:Hydrolase n=1 Tax=Kurthia sibirica TaxID=202750 RepID=A0A2U3ALS1_9BACL|nr:isochorismatase family protein [Kurthia sibirica]PWI25459.1 hydrolase [Kurthia sibirica]GEK34960.1 hydrolase [Kurthia sibirica]
MNLEQTAVVVIDVQGKLATLMNNADHTVRKITQLIQGANVLELPVLWLEQYPKGLGPTVDTVAAEMIGTPIEKITFSAWRTDEFKKALIASGKKQVLLCGIEAHICVFQTARDLKNAGFIVEVLADATDSRTAIDYQIALTRLQQEHILLTSVEMALFDLVEVASGEQFKKISKIVK